MGLGEIVTFIHQIKHVLEFQQLQITTINLCKHGWSTSVTEDHCHANG